MVTKVKSLPKIAFYMCPTCIGLLNIKTVTSMEHVGVLVEHVLVYKISKLLRT
jgi:hypothetical protein